MSTLRNARIDLKLKEALKTHLKRAAQYSGKTLTEFLLSAAEEKADQVMQERERILASKRDQEIFFEALMHPPEPNENLKRAAARYLEES